MKLSQILSAAKAQTNQQVSAVAPAIFVISAAALAIGLTTLLRYEPMLTSLKAQQRSLESTVHERGTFDSVPEIPALDQWQTMLLSPAFVNNVSRELSSLMLSNRVSMTQLRFTDVPASAALPASVEIQLNARGTYPQIRKVLFSSLNKMPSLSLKTLQLKQKEASDSAALNTRAVDAQITLVIFIKELK